MIVSSSEKNQNKISRLGSKVLGLGYDAAKDKIYIDLSISISKDNKTEKVKFLPDANLISQICNNLTKGNILSIIKGIYDAIGLISSITIKLRVAFRTLFQAKSTLGWNDPFQDKDVQDNWLVLIKKLVEAKEVSFPRATTFSNAVGKSQLTCYFDESSQIWPMLFQFTLVGFSLIKQSKFHF